MERTPDESRTPRFLGSSHWRAIFAESGRREPRSAARDPLASSLWRLGASAFKSALPLPGGGERETLLAQAEKSWQESVLSDPGMTDGWLGLLLVERARQQQSDRFPALSLALAVTAPRLGEEQARYDVSYSLAYPLLFSYRASTDEPDDLRLFHAIHRMLAGADHEARQWVACCSSQNHRVLAAQASLALRAQDWAAALPACRLLALSDEPELSADGLVGAGMALVELGRTDEAQITLDQALVHARRPQARLSAHYGLAMLYRARGEQHRERAELELIETSEPDFADVAGRLAHLREDLGWQALEDQLAGPLADDPKIPDNQ